MIHFRKGLVMVLLCAGLMATAQTESLSPLKSNSTLRASYAAAHSADQTKRYITESQFLIQSDTLSLPFIDDFSENSLRPIDFPQPSAIIDSVFASGLCLEARSVSSVDLPVMFSTSWRYFYDSLSQSIDSIANDAITLTIYDQTGQDCFGSVTSTITVWPQYYNNYVADTFGRLIDSSLVTEDTILRASQLVQVQMLESAKWLDNTAFINNNLPILPPSIGVATLDGLDSDGLPYNKNNPTAWGKADMLSSKPIALDGLNQDSSVFLSFFFQAQGNGDFPNPEDSLIVEFKDKVTGKWIEVWARTGYRFENEVPSGFQQAIIQLKDTTSISGPRYFYDGFQFRFRNRASLTGNNDHWHIDYVRLDKNRSFADSTVFDVAFMEDFPNLLLNYESMPWDQFQADPQLVNEIELTIRNNNELASPVTTYSAQTTESLGGTLVFDTSGNFNAFPFVTRTIPTSGFNLPAVLTDSIALNSIFVINPSDDNIVTSNDTVFGRTLFHNQLAYDDGTAERAYGLEGLGLKKFAYKFNLNKPDTLAGFQIHFANIDVNVSNLVFNFVVWDSLALNDIFGEDSVTKEIFNRKPFYVDSMNGFATFKFDTPILVYDHFYLGWAQTDERNLQIGYDLNSTKGRPNMFVHANGSWGLSSISLPGSPMIRAILDGNYTNPATGIDEPQFESAFDFTIYPNPVKGDLNIALYGAQISDLEIEIISSNGQRAFSGQARNFDLNLNTLPNGLYFLRLLDKRSGEMKTRPFHLNHP